MNLKNIFRKSKYNTHILEIYWPYNNDKWSYNIILL
jgi:hypothetical protein